MMFNSSSTKHTDWLVDTVRQPYVLRSPHVFIQSSSIHSPTSPIILHRQLQNYVDFCNYCYNLELELKFFFTMKCQLAASQTQELN